MKVKLTKKQYLGVGYIDTFKNDDGIVNVPCTEEQYNSYSNGSQPTLDGYVWLGSSGGTIKVDNPDTVLKDGEYCEYEDGYYINISKDGVLISRKVPLEWIVNDEIDDFNIKNIWQ